MLQDIWFYAFVITVIILGWVWGRLRDKLSPLYEIIAGLRLERDAQARTIEFQRKVISELENKGGPNLGAFRGAFAKSNSQPCKIPPTGWYCTRNAGHEGPCAALPLQESKEQ